MPEKFTGPLQNFGFEDLKQGKVQFLIFAITMPWVITKDSISQDRQSFVLQNTLLKTESSHI